ncbi:MAG: sulfatase-like hydrolase/transferase [Phycisphaera sp.]|nr:sulfatase-like hydrolase/transferase [Phycisphaera sp.]
MIALVVAALFGVHRPARTAEPDKRMNVLFLVIDDLNTWLLQDPNRYTGKVVTPNIHKLADSGVNFTHAFAAAPKCCPSRTSFLSGVAPWKSGVTDNGVAVADSKVLPGKISMPELFKENGYFIASFGKVSHGYDLKKIWDAQASHKRDPIPPGAMLNGNSRKSENDWGPTHLAESEMNDTKMADLAIAQLGQKHDKPFFLACGVFHPHAPYYVPQKYLDMYPQDQIVAPPINEHDLDDVPAAGQKLISGTYAWAKANGQYKGGLQGYLASSTYSDTQMGRVLDALDASPYRDNTIVVLLSDHGYHVGEKLHWQKGTLWEEATNCLLMFRVPGVTAPHQTCERPVSLLDIYPTLAELTGLPKPAHLDGVSLVPLLKDPSAARERPVVTAYQNHLCVRTERYRYIQYGDGSEELYDRETDPHEWKNVASVAEFAAIKKALAAELPTPGERAPVVPYVRKGKDKDE